MNVPDIATAAEAFLAGLASFDGRLKPEEIVLNRDAGRFADIFRDRVPPCAGAYWFFLPGGKVFDIGMSDTNIWGRISVKAGVAEWRGDPAAEYLDTTGEGWGFPNSNYLRGGTAKDATSEAILKGEFHVGWITVKPHYVATLIEVYLQTLCRAADDDLPEFCFRIG